MSPNKCLDLSMEYHILLPLAFVGIAVLTGMAGCSPKETQPPDFKNLSALFAYNPKADLNTRAGESERRGGIVIRDVAFTPVPGRGEVSAYLVTPPEPGPHAGILWVHWLGETMANRTQFLEEAVALASRGNVSLLVNAMWSDSGWYGKRIPEEDYSHSIRQVIELRRAMDLLLSQPNVDPKRIAVVGHDYGGMYASIMGGVDQRAITFVLVAVTPSLNDWAYFGTQPKSNIEYVRENAVFEIPMYVREIKNASILFQFGKQDFFVSGAGAAIYFRSANDPKERKWYDADHEMNKPEIRADREAWLVKELKLR